MRRVLHGTQDIAGGASLVAEAMRDLGIDAQSYCMRKNPYSEVSHDLTLSSYTRLNVLKKAIECSVLYDTFFFWFGRSLLSSHLWDIPLLKKFGKQIYMIFCGCDIRDEKHTILNYPISACNHCFPKLCNVNRDWARSIAEKHADGVFVSTPDLLEFVDGAELLPQPMNEIFLRDIGERSGIDYVPGKELIVAHAPTNRMMKGTRYLLEATESLRAQGYKIRVELIEGLPHREALRKYVNAHVAVDQLLSGAYGVTSVEMMALGVPVLVYLREDLVEKYHESPPVINANPMSIESTLKQIVNGDLSLSQFSSAGKEYAAKYHSPKAVAEILNRKMRMVDDVP